MKRPTYPKYKPSGVEWLGDGPAHWDVKQMRNLATVETGDKDTVNAVNAVDDGEYPFYVRSQIVERIDSFTFDREAVLTAGDGVGVGRVFHHHLGGRLDQLVAKLVETSILTEITGQARNRRFKYQSDIDLFHDPQGL